MSRKAVPYLLLLLIGLAMAVGGFLLLDTKVTCDGEEMRPGDQCIEYSDTSRKAYTFDEYADKGRRQSLVIMIGGLVIAAGSAFGAWRAGRTQHTQAEAAAAWQQGS
ncbi:hypothetical protein [Catellatospora tritici]|uniref:hypothetical protein n=1 Tax=Catellatospora tritici TaxID=2851566 RepID=UPI001C2DAEDD|nr:hypothetical protein [Catellatospora tritici]MBV1854242.1 hypothetical protein [Catellatospora tritici]